jgi:hypothetical protein
VELCVIRLGTRPDNNIERRELWDDPAPQKLAELSPQAVARYDGSAKSRNHESESGMPLIIGEPSQVEARGPAAAA